MKTEHVANIPKFETANDSDLGHKIIFCPPRSGMSISPSLPGGLQLLASGKILPVGKTPNKTTDAPAVKKMVVPFYRQFGKHYPT